METQDAPTPDLRDQWAHVQGRIAASARLCLLTDFDGTLVPLAADPDAPRLESPVRQILENLIRHPRVVLGIVSGRGLHDLVSRIDLRGCWYVGNHGFEIRDPEGIERRFYEPEDVAYLTEVRDEMGRETAAIPGVFLEHKGPVLAVHHRNVPEARVVEVELAFSQVMQRHRARLMISRGHAVLEARLRGGSNKGTAVRHLRREMPPGTLMMYFGDDLTDRDAFRALKGVGLTVEIGGGSGSIADFTLPGPAEVLATLARIGADLDLIHTPEGPARRRPGRRGT